MTGIKNIVGDARQICRELLEEQRPSKREYGDISVSFRGPGGSVGRRDFATHWIHWYPAKMFHRIPSIFLDTLRLPTQAKVLDPFCGSGTVLLEANLRGLGAIGIDINPLATLISRVKTTPLDPAQLSDQVGSIMTKAKRARSMPPPHPALDSWLSASVRIGLHRLNRSIDQMEDEDSKLFFKVSLSSIVRRLSMADPAIPPLVRLSEERAQCAGAQYRKALDRSRATNTSIVYSTFAEAAKANIARMAQLYELRNELGKTRLAKPGYAAAETGIEPESIDAVITSPPYCGSQKYVRSLKLELAIIGLGQEDIRRIDRQTMGSEAITNLSMGDEQLLTGDRISNELIGRINVVNPKRARMASTYVTYLSKFAVECQRILRPGGHLLVTLGRSTMGGIAFPSDIIFRRAGESAGLEFIGTLVDSIPSRGLITERHKTAGRIDHEHIVWLRRPRHSNSD